MDKNLKNILIFAGTILGLLLSVASVNYFMDPMCYYRCDTVDVTRKTQNVYYQAAQTVAANPDVEVLILGSSRGETTSPLWVQEVTGMKTVNLSKGGSGLMLKLALLKTAADFQLPVKKVIWIADYFEFSEISTDMKVRLTPVLNQGLNQQMDFWGQVQAWTSGLQRLIDHKSFEASLAQIKTKPGENFFEAKGSGAQIDYKLCASPDFKGKRTPELLKKEVHLSYGQFLGPLTSTLSEGYLQAFHKQIHELEAKGIEVLILIPPYHPDLMDRFKLEHAAVYELHKKWEASLLSLQSQKVIVKSYLEGFPNDSKGPDFWDDGAHPTCKAMMRVLQPEL